MLMNDGGATIANGLWALGALVLVGSALIARRMPVSHLLKSALAWAAIFGLIFTAVQYKDNIARAWQSLIGSSTQSAGQTMRIQQADDGHFWADVRLNGVSTRFLIDSGATVTSITPDTAKAAGIKDDGGPASIVITANGPAVEHAAQAATLELGTIKHQNEHIRISERADAGNMLGMSFLSQLKSWHVDHKVMTLEP